MHKKAAVLPARRLAGAPHRENIWSHAEAAWAGDERTLRWGAASSNE
jgi:hypothetical protein